MKEHLSGRRMAECVCGAATPEGERHFRECPQCGAEIARLQSALGHFRESLRGWGDVQSQSALENVRAANRRPARAWFRWPILAAALLALAVAPVYKTVRDRRQAAQALADAQLLEQVNREISEAVPSPMEPLAQLVSWGPASQEKSEGSTQKGEVR